MWELLVFLFIGWYGVGMAAGLGLLGLKVVRRQAQQPPATALPNPLGAERRAPHAADEQAWSAVDHNAA